MQLEILTPDRKLFSGEVSSVTVPGSEGAFTLLNNHAPIVSTLEKGVVLISGQTPIPIKGGICEVVDGRVTVLARI